MAISKVSNRTSTRNTAKDSTTRKADPEATHQLPGPDLWPVPNSKAITEQIDLACSMASLEADAEDINVVFERFNPLVVAVSESKGYEKARDNFRRWDPEYDHLTKETPEPEEGSHRSDYDFALREFFAYAYRAGQLSFSPPPECAHIHHQVRAASEDMEATEADFDGWPEPALIDCAIEAAVAEVTAQKAVEDQDEPVTLQLAIASRRSVRFWELAATYERSQAREDAEDRQFQLRWLCALMLRSGQLMGTDITEDTKNVQSAASGTVMHDHPTAS